MIYLASPYTTDDGDQQKAWTKEAGRLAYEYGILGYNVYSPVAYGVAIEGHGGELGWQYWMAHCKEMLLKCRVMFILTIDGWEGSKGIAEEMDLCKVASIPVYLVDPSKPTKTEHMKGFVRDPWVDRGVK